MYIKNTDSVNNSDLSFPAVLKGRTRWGRGGLNNSKIAEVYQLSVIPYLSHVIYFSLQSEMISG